MKNLDSANKYLLENKDKINKTYRSKFHMEPSVGWMNDPNGLIFYNGEFHLFYQSNVFNSLPSDMAWGHFVSSDLISYKEVELALYPTGREKGETGCFTGSCFVENNELKIVYTNHFDGIKPEPTLQTQYICTTEDVIKFKKEDKPCIDEKELPSNLSRSDFRDPQIFYKDGLCNLIIGCHDDEDNGVFVIYSGQNSSDLHYSFHFGPFEHTDRMVECPSFIKIGNKDVIVFSTYKFDGTNGVYYIIGTLDVKNKQFIMQSNGYMDCGDAFYAPKVIENYQIPTIFGWMENWNKKYKTHELNHGWTGSFTLPRVLFIKNNELYQSIHPNLNNYVTKVANVITGETISKHSINTFDFNSDFILKIRSEDSEVIIYKKENKIHLDTNKSNNLNGKIMTTRFEYETGSICFVLDTSSIEIFINEGRETITSRIYLNGDNYSIDFEGFSVLKTKNI